MARCTFMITWIPAWFCAIHIFQCAISRTESQGTVSWSQASSRGDLKWAPGLSSWATSLCDVATVPFLSLWECTVVDGVIFYSSFPNGSVIRIRGTANSTLCSPATWEGQLADQQHELCAPYTKQWNSLIEVIVWQTHTCLPLSVIDNNFTFASPLGSLMFSIHQTDGPLTHDHTPEWCLIVGECGYVEPLKLLFIITEVQQEEEKKFG